VPVDYQAGHVLERRKPCGGGLDHWPAEVHPREELATLVDPHGVHEHQPGRLDPGQPYVVVDQLDRTPELRDAESACAPRHRVQPEHAIHVREPDAHEPGLTGAACLHVHRKQVFRVSGISNAKSARRHAGQRIRGPGLCLDPLVVPAGRPKPGNGCGQHAQVASARSVRYGGRRGCWGRGFSDDVANRGVISSGGSDAPTGRMHRGGPGHRLLRCRDRGGREGRATAPGCRSRLLLLLAAPARHHPAPGQR